MKYNAEYAKTLRENQKYDQLFAYCKNYENDSEAMVELATCYYYGYGIEKDYSKCFYYDKMAANRGNANGKATLAYNYLRGIGTVKNYALALDLLKQSVNDGCPKAYRFLGYCYENGTGVEKDEVRAAELYAKAAEMGDCEAERYLGVCYRDEIGVEKDIDKAFYLFLSSAQHGNIEACHDVGVCYKEGVGTDVNIENAVTYFEKCVKHVDNFNDIVLAEIWTNMAECYKEQKDNVRMVDAYNNALKLYKNMVDSNRSIGYAEYFMGEIREKGGNGIQDYSKAFHHYEQALLNGAEFAARKVARFYEIGQVVSKDKKKAFSIIKKYSEKDEFNKITLGVYYDYGIGIKRDSKSAVAIYTQCLDSASEYISGLAKCCLGICYYHGAGVQKDISKALALFESSTEGMMTTYYIRAINDRDADSIFMLSLLYRYGLENIFHFRPNYRRAFEFCKEAYELSNYEKYQKQLAEMYFFGIGVKRDLQKAYNLYLEDGDDESKQILGEYYYYGCNVTIDYCIAIKYFSLGARNKNSRAIFNMGLCYLHGKGVNQNVEYAMELFESIDSIDDVYSRWAIGIDALVILSNLSVYKEKEKDAMHKLEILSSKSSFWKATFNLWKSIPSEKVAEICVNLVEKHIEILYMNHIPYFFMFKTMAQFIGWYFLKKKKYEGIWELKKEISQLKRELARMHEPIADELQEIVNSQIVLQEQLERIDVRTKHMEFQLNQLLYFAENDLQNWLRQEKEKLAPFITENDEQIISAFADKLTRYLNEHIRNSDNLIREEIANLQEVFGSTWDKLLPTTRTSLISAGILWNYCTDMGNNFDYSGVCISATSVL